MHFYKKFPILAVSIATALICSSVQSQDQSSLDDDNKKFSYVIGYQIGQSVLAQIETVPNLDMTSFLEAISASLKGEDSVMSQQEMSDVMIAVQQQIQEETMQRAQENAEKSRAYLDENKTKDGVIVTESGIQYQVIQSGDPTGNSPSLEDTVVVHYEGSLIDGTVFDSSRSRDVPARFSLTGIIPGWTEVLQIMRPGDIWKIALPPEMAYGETGIENVIGPNQVLIFEIELIEVVESPNS